MERELRMKRERARPVSCPAGGERVRVRGGVRTHVPSESEHNQLDVYEANLAIVNECRLPTAGAIECYPSPCVRRYAFVGL